MILDLLMASPPHPGNENTVAKARIQWNSVLFIEYVY